MNIHPANISGEDVATAYLRPIRSISHPAGTAMAKLPMSMHATIHEICVDVSDRGARPADMYSMTGDGHPSTIPAMNTGNDAVGMRENKLTANTREGEEEKLTGQGVMLCFIVGLAD